MTGSKYSNSDHYIDPKTGILKNKLGARTKAELADAESEIVFLRISELESRPIRGKLFYTCDPCIGAFFKKFMNGRANCELLIFQKIPLDLHHIYICKAPVIGYFISSLRKII